MSANKDKKAPNLILGKYADWVGIPDPEEFENNVLAMRLLIQQRQFTLATSIDLERQVKELEAKVHKLELQNQRLRLELDEAARKSALVFLLSLLATVLVGIGVNVATSKPENWMGWLLIMSACVIEGLAFFSRHQRAK